MDAPSRLRLSAALGNALEWFDFAVYGAFANAIGHAFFPSVDHNQSLLASFGVFAIGYLMRPLGGLLFGAVGDLHGRRTLLLGSLLTMVVASLLLALLPGYDRWGPAAAWGLTLLRMVQGLCVGGQYAGAITDVVESAPIGRQGRHASEAAAGTMVGFVAGSLMAALLYAVLPLPDLEAWGWRLPFLFGAVLGLVAFQMRRSLPENRPRSAAARLDLTGLFGQLRDHGPLLLLVMLLLSFAKVTYYLVFVFWVQQSVAVNPHEAGMVNAITCLVEALGIPLILIGGIWTDRRGPLPMMRLWSLLLLVLVVPGMLLLSRTSPSWLALGLWLVAVPLMPLMGTYPALLPRLFSPELRCTGVALAYSLGVAAVGGTAPALAAWMLQRGLGGQGPLLYALLWAGVSLLALHQLSRQRSLQES